MSRRFVNKTPLTRDLAFPCCRFPLALFWTTAVADTLLSALPRKEYHRAGYFPGTTLDYIHSKFFDYSTQSSSPGGQLASMMKMGEGKLARSFDKGFEKWDNRRYLATILIHVPESRTTSFYSLGHADVKNPECRHRE